MFKYCFCLICSVFILLNGVGVSQAAEYEVFGTIHQVITEPNGYREESINGFSVFVRKCGWLIEITTVDKKGNTYKEEIGSTNGTEIFELVGGTSIIYSNNIPVGFLDKSLGGHLWLMFALQCYWGGLKSDLITSVFDYHACAAFNPDLRSPAEWKLLNGPGSLPREVVFFGKMDETNDLYLVTGTTNVGGTVVPTSVMFEERYAVARRGMVLRKRVEAEVTTVRGVCSKASLLPAPGVGTVNVDYRLLINRDTSKLATYRTPVAGKWLSVEEARKLAPPLSAPSVTVPAKESNSNRRVFVLSLLIGLAALGPLAIFAWWWKDRKTGGLG
jgi:hypothetical protein